MNSPTRFRPSFETHNTCTSQRPTAILSSYSNNNFYFATKNYTSSNVPSPTKNSPYTELFFPSADDGLSLALKFLVRNFRLGTGSRFCLLAKHRSAVSTHTSRKLRRNSSTQKAAYKRLFLARAMGADPTTSPVHFFHYFHNGMDYIFTLLTQ
jgi:hypothetical protein